MHKIENLKNSLEEILKNPLDGFNMNNQLKTLATKLIEIEKEFQSVRSNYKIEFSPLSNGYVKEGNHLTIKLFYSEEEIYSQNTFNNFVIYGNASEYELCQSNDIKRGIQKEISFKKKPELYIELIENELIKCFLKKEKLLAQQIAIIDLNINLRIVEKVEEPNIKNSYSKLL